MNKLRAAFIGTGCISDLHALAYLDDERAEIVAICDSNLQLAQARGHGKMLDAPPVVLYRDRTTRTFSDMPVGWQHSFINSTRQFIDAWFSGDPPQLTGEQGREVLRFALAAQESARLGRSVKL